jgi:hypothetical protein
MQRLSQVGKCPLHGEGQLILVDIAKMVFVSLDKSLFYMAMPCQHGQCRIQAIDVICHCHSSV